MSSEHGEHPHYERYYEEGLQAAKDLRNFKIEPEDFARQHALSLIRLLRTDHRTGLLNSEGLEHALNLTIRGVGGRPLSLIYIDGNQFKRINDILLHQTGDRVIVAMAKALESVNKTLLTAHLTEDPGVETTPVIADHSRQGGDEFVVVCFEYRSNAIKLAKRLKVTIREYVHREVPVVEKRIPGGFTVSTGTEELKKSPLEDAKSLIKRAEDRMYREREAERSFFKRLTHLRAHFAEALEAGMSRLHNIRPGH